MPDWFEYRLTYNFRNTKKIADLVKTLGRVEIQSHDRCPEGEEPEVREMKSPAKTCAAIEQLIKNLISKQKVLPEQIAILTPRTHQNSCLEDIETLAGLELTDKPLDRSDKLLHTTIGAFKGLESDVLILADIDPRDPRSNRNAQYVAASRARNRLFVFGNLDKT